MPVSDGLRVYATADGTWLEFSASNGKKAALRIETIASEKVGIIGMALRLWCNDRQAQARIAEDLAEQALGDLDGAKSDDVILALCTLFLDVNIVARAEIKADAARILLIEWKRAVEDANRQPDEVESII